MSKPIALILHPKEWATSEYGKNGKLSYVHVSIGGKVPKKKSGVPTFDGYAECVTCTGEAALAAAFEKYKPNFFLFWLHTGLTPKFLFELKRVSPNTKFIHWFGNHRNSVSGSVSNVKAILDGLFLNSKHPAQIGMYRKFGVRNVGTLYDGFAPSEVTLIESTPIYDCTFGGETYLKLSKENPKLDFPGAILRYEFIVQAHKKFKVGVYSALKGGGWPFPTLPEVYHPQYTEALRKGAITLNVNHFIDFRQAYTRRTIRSLFARRCHITYYIPGMEVDFINHKHLVWFKTIEEGLDMIRYYLDHPEEREAIAWAGWRLAMEKYTFEARMKDFEDFCLSMK